MNVKDFFDIDIEISEIMTDSRKKTTDAVFFAIEGLSRDGHDFIEQAISNGAIMIVHSKDLETYDPDVIYIKADDTLKCLNEFAAFFNDYPSKKMHVFGVTGTNGKTTISYMIYDILNRIDSCGYIGTLGYAYDKSMHEQYYTTPTAEQLQSILKEIYDNGCQNVAIEVSSQGLDLHRADTVDFDCVMFTNLTHDHLDYHKTFENYYKAKAKLFEIANKNGVAIINTDDEYGRRLYDECNIRKVSYGMDKGDYHLENVELSDNRSSFDIIHEEKHYHIESNLLALYNVYNILCAFAALVESGYDPEVFIDFFKDISLIPGRMERIDEGQNFDVIVDFAHTPDGFNKIIDYARSICQGKIIVTFGMAGSRDRLKRPIIGEIVDEKCDEIILTSDDNHYERFEDIANEIMEGIKKKKAMIIEDRIEAIEYAISRCQSGDCLLILGKGDDDFNKVEDRKEPYPGDNNVAREILKRINDKEIGEGIMSELKEKELENVVGGSGREGAVTVRVDLRDCGPFDRDVTIKPYLNGVLLANQINTVDASVEYVHIGIRGKGIALLTVNINDTTVKYYDIDFDFESYTER